MPTLYNRRNNRRWNIRGILGEFFSNRLVIVGLVMGALFMILAYRLFVLQIVEGADHLANFNYKVEKTIKLNGTRGNIYDSKGNLLAYNQLAYAVTLERTDRISDIAKKRSEKTGREVTANDVLNEEILNLLNLLNEHGDDVNYDLPLKLNKKGKIKFTVSGASLTRFKKDVYAIINIDNLRGDDRKKAEGWLNASPEEVYEYLRTGKDGPVGTGRMFDISDDYTTEETLRIMSIRYDLYMNRYSQTTPITVATNISDKSIAALSESLDQYPGVSIAADSLRKYNKARYFAGIIGYTGIISESELSEYNENGGSYEASDVVGKTGIEKMMESSLQGKKGEQKVLVDNLGKVIKVVSTTKSESGNDIYLTIDSDLQEYAYNILERRLAGIILAHLTSADEAGTDKMIPIKDVYFALFDNNIIDISHFNSAKASGTEEIVYDIYRQKQARVLSNVRKSLTSGKTPMKNLGKERQEYLYYAYNMLKEDNVLVTAGIDEEDPTYQKWQNGSISLRRFLRKAISNEWIDISMLDIKSDYYDADEIYKALTDYIIEGLKKEEDFDKILYKYMIKSGELSGKRVCLLLYNQGVLNKDKDKDYRQLHNDEISAYTFMQKKIRDIDITPAQLALDPCSGSVIITDPETGEVKAMVSYPSYNNNKLANGIDSNYYARLNADKSSPMLNRATQTRTAPGSTFKPVSATAFLEENLIDQSTYVKCTGLFDEITPNAKCWIYPSAHGMLNVSGAIAVSCNYFFYQNAYNMGMKNGNYNSEKGLKILKKYASIYGFNRKSGLEITEYEPRISDEDAVRSAIGQGTNSYTPSQISRYVTSLVNEKDLIKLTLVKETRDVQGNVLEKHETESDGKLAVDDNTFTLIKTGMRDVVYGKNSSIKSLYAKQGLKVAGKTGTAQENKKRPNHALFISYAPYDEPEITMTVVVPNGYTSHNAAEIARDIYRYYFDKATKEEKKAKTALMPSGSDGSND
ncbi:MAG: peptidase [Eubacterium sp.]|nr:peptidase [Eubacterium sp.]